MLNKLNRHLFQPGDTVICAVSGGADSMALLFALYLKREEFGIRLEAAHFNHRLRGEESDGDESFVREFCEGYAIPLHVGRENVVAGKKGLEAAARDARYRFFASLDGKIATAHTADDNAETVLMHLVRGTGLKGLGGIAPVNGRLIRPMLNVTRQQVMEFLEEYHVSYRTDSSNETDTFLRNRLRHHVMPLLKEENPRLAEKLSAMAQRLRMDEQALAEEASFDVLPPVSRLRQLQPAVRSRMLEQFLKQCGVKEPEAEHIALAESLVFSDKPSARGHFPGGVTVGRSYEQLIPLQGSAGLARQCLACEMPVQTECFRITATESATMENTAHVFTVHPVGQMVVRSRESGDTMRLNGGTKSLKKLFADRKIPSHQRQQIPVIADDMGVLGVYGIGVNLDRKAEALPAIRIDIEKTERVTEE